MTPPARPRAVVPVSLAELATVAGVTRQVPDLQVTGVTLRSSDVRPGDLYAALPGDRTHGSRFVADARAAGAVAVLTDAAGAAMVAPRSLPTVVVVDPRAVLGRVAATVYGRPADSLTLVGVTGTQGKTTTTHLLAGGLAAAGRRTAVIGTMGTWIDGELVGSRLTTPEAPDLHALFAVMRERGVEVCAMEVSSHALVLRRVDGVRYDAAVFTNFGRDHLDFHGDESSYFAAKAGLFTAARARMAVLNADDAAVVGLRDRLTMPTHTFGVTSPDADWRADEVQLTATGSTFRLTGPSGVDAIVALRLPGDFNVANALAALAAVGAAGLDVKATAAGLAQVDKVRGRLERVEVGQLFTVVVDYAHKPDALTAVLTTLRATTNGRLIVVLGAGGDRDHGKRPLLGAVAGRLADVVVVTDDNPRTEDPSQIRAAVVSGTRSAGADVLEVGDRRAAIEHALRTAGPGDTVLVAGKGHETGQYVGDTVVPFDDRAVVQELLAGLAVEASPP